MPDNRDIAHRLPPPPPGGPVAPHLLRSYFNAAARGTGVPVHYLLAVAAVESGFNPVAVGPFLPQYAGTENERALGMMQFLPSTYRPYARFVDRVTGKNLGMRGLWDPESAVWAAAFYLRDNGAPGNMSRALFRYNNADWYVRLVHGWADYYAQGGPLGSAPVLDRARVASLRDPSQAPTLRAATAPAERASARLGRDTAITESLATLMLLGLDRPSWPRFSVPSQMLPF
jgi:hypothetical protein